MTPETLSSLVGDLTPVFGTKAAAAVGVVLLTMVCISHGLMPWLPLPDKNSKSFYVSLYNFLRLLAGNYGNASPNGLNQ